MTAFAWADELPTIPLKDVELSWLRDGDAPALFEIFSDPEVMRFWSSPPLQDQQAAQALLDEIRELFRARRLFQWGVRKREDGRIVGTCTLFNWDRAHRRAEIGFAVARREWGRGIAGQATAGLIQFAFDTLALHRLEADVDPRNSISLRVLERHGFKREGLLRERYHQGGELQDSVLLGLLAREWQRRLDYSVQTPLGEVRSVRAMQPPRYDAIGHGYAQTRREDPRFRERIHAALGDARTVVNVGAGAGAYEPRDRHVIAIEPSDVMAAQRPRDLAPAIRASAGCIPLRDRSVDAAMAVLSVHHWDEERERGVRELRRVARDAVVILTYDAQVSSAMWLMADYLPEVAALDRQIFPAPEQLARWLGGDVRIETMPIPRDTPDWMLGSFWAHPERVLDANARAATSGFARMPREVVDRVVSAVSRDLASGAWDIRHGQLRSVDELDLGLRLIVATPTN